VRRAAVAGVILALAGCRRHAVPTTAGAVCPPAARIAALVGGRGRTVIADCVAYAPGFFWLGATLAYDSATKQDPRLSLIYGGHPPRAYDIGAAPADVLTRLISGNQDLRVSVRKPSPASHVVRLGVYGQHGDHNHPEADELVVILGLVAHAPPQILWMGDGDRIRTAADGCIALRTVDLDIPFGDRLEMATAERSRRADGTPAPCPPGRNMRQTIGYRPTPLPQGRVLREP